MFFTGPNVAFMFLEFFVLWRKSVVLRENTSSVFPRSYFFFLEAEALPGCCFFSGDSSVCYWVMGCDCYSA